LPFSPYSCHAFVHCVELAGLALYLRDVGGDVHRPERHQHLLDGLAAALHERLDEPVGLLVPGDVVQGDHGDPLVAQLGGDVPAAGRFLLIAAHRAPEQDRARLLVRQVVGRRLRDDGGHLALVHVVADGDGGRARHGAQDHVDLVALDELPRLGETHVRLAFFVLHDQADGPARHLAAHLVLPVELDAFVHLGAVDGERPGQRIEQPEPDGLARSLREHRRREREEHERDETDQSFHRSPPTPQTPR
jgi:hypothetical protein